MLNPLPIHEVKTCQFIFQTESSIPMTDWTMAFLVRTVYVPQKVNVSFKASKSTAEPILSNTCGISFPMLSYVIFSFSFDCFPLFFALSNIWHLLILTQNSRPLYIGKDRFHCTSMPQKVIQIWLHTQYGGTDSAQWDVLYLLPEDGHDQRSLPDGWVAITITIWFCACNKRLNIYNN